MQILSSSSPALVVTSTLLWAALPALAQEPAVKLNAMTYKGCYSWAKSFDDEGPYEFQSSGYCQEQCAPQQKAVMGLAGGDHCWCGDELPPSSKKLSNSECDSPCKGFNKNFCGGNDRWSIYLTGTNNNVDEAKDDDDEDDNKDPNKRPQPRPTKAPAAGVPDGDRQVTSIITLGDQTQTVTRENPTATGVTSAPPSKESASRKPNTAGIAAGVVVGVVAIGAAIGAAFFILRRRKRRNIEQDYRRNAAANLGNGGKPGSASSISDSRLEPSVMMQRRMSDGSMADNQDYSRRILKVTNPDGT
ncbi:MAG: hypothetical protein M1837_004904 [Sclerophora amabilis]|nr:MAG: hypothetical protein M1837_004904 [Sclerophora amabilis]